MTAAAWPLHSSPLDCGPGRRAVQFYESDDALAGQVAELLEAGLSAGARAVVIAGEAHWRLFESRLETRGCDVGALVASRRLTVLDPHRLREEAMPGPLPNREKLREVVGAEGGRPVRVYDELADLLWKVGEHEGALLVEELWDELARRDGVVLLSAYSAARLAPAAGDPRTRALSAEVAHREVVERALRSRVAALLADEERERARARRHAELQDATARLAGALTEADVSSVLLEVAADVVKAAAGVVYLADGSGQLRLQAARGASAMLERHRVLRPEAALPLSEAARRRAPIFIGSHERLMGDYPAMQASETPAERLQSVAALPLIHGTRLVGAYALSFDRPQPFDDDQQRFLMGIAAQAALAADRARLYEAERSAREEAETLFRIGEALSATQLDLETIVQRVTDEATRLTTAQFGAFFYNVFDAQGGSYSLYALSGAPREAFAKFGLPRNTPIFAPTFEGHGVVRLDDVTKDRRYGQVGPHHGMPKGHLPVTSYLAVPVVSRSGLVLGGLFFGHSQPGRFTEQHERIVKSIAASAALAIDNAKLFRAAREAEESQKRLVNDLVETVRFNELFMGVLAHDLRSPLAAILSAAQLVKSRDATTPDPRNRKAIDRVLASGERMTRMIEQLLDFTRVRFGGQIPIERRPTDLSTCLGQVIGELEVAYPGSAVELRVTGDVRGAWDGDRLAQLFSNLGANALQHGAAGGGVRVTVDGSRPDRVEVRVHNLGAIPPELVPSIFEPLTGGQRRRDGSRGLGLGLFVTKRIAEAHGGDVGVVSNEAEGTTFTVTLPRSSEAIEEAKQAEEGATGPGRSRSRADSQRLGDELKTSETRFRLLVEAVKDYAIFMLDPTGRVVTWNAGARRIKGYEAHEIIGHHFSRFYEEEEIRSGKCEMELEVAAREGRFEDEGWRLRKDGSKFWANVVITALRDPKDHLVGFAKVTRDLTERRSLEQERLRLAKAEEAIRLRDEFLSLASHELKTPLTVLQMQLESLNERLEGLDSKLTKKIKRAAQSSERLNNLVESLLDVSRIATGRFTLNVKEFDLVEALRRLVEQLHPAAERSGCEVLFEPIEPAIVGRWDRLRLEQVIGNLLGNAMKYGAGSPIRLSAGQHEDGVVIEVRDHGPGIPVADLPRIFGRFERAAPIRNYGGLGLGLYLIREIVDAHGGWVMAENAEGGGALFRVHLPLAAPPPDATQQAN